MASKTLLAVATSFVNPDTNWKSPPDQPLSIVLLSSEVFTAVWLRDQFFWGVTTYNWLSESFLINTDEDTMKWLWKWTCIKLVTLLWYWKPPCQWCSNISQKTKFSLLFCFPKDRFNRRPAYVVGTATRYGLDDGGSNLVGLKFSASVQTDPEEHPAPYIMGTRSFAGLKQPGVAVTTHPT
jgi:hypothetical protein